MSLGHTQTILYSLCHVPSTHSSHYFNYCIMSLWHIHPITVIALLTFFAVFYSVESRLAPRRSRQTDNQQYVVSGSQIRQWASPPENMPNMALQEALRLGNSSPLVPHLHRIAGMVRKPGNKPVLTHFSKLHPGK